ncbi:GNAT family N-acetyltransferase [Hoeflea alexandrii]|uniref:GNAT family N-acetyltransferase n=1 Tax=Hoeflea alexandrii TaxID=288436 RepID=UPI0022AED84D|nr:GNAT family N-acetyltransferase [Hoeflea alexandrii]MCZ4291090.1 GNAT family N-acetyltransferase [Hoeflea alexandrii]
MEPAPDPDIRFGRLADLAPEVLVAHMSDPRMRDHMPLLTSAWDLEVAQSFVAAKEACWRRDGLGHWAIFDGDRYVGWGGFQKEGEEWDFGLVLKPQSFGLGARIARQALAFARADERIPFVTFLLPPSRRNLGALARLGARLAGEIDHDGARFRKFVLETPSHPAIPGMNDSGACLV